MITTSPGVFTTDWPKRLTPPAGTPFSANSSDSFAARIAASRSAARAASVLSSAIVMPIS